MEGDYPIQEVAGLAITSEQHGRLHDWDVWLEGTLTQLEKDKPHILEVAEQRKKADEYMRRTLPELH